MNALRFLSCAVLMLFAVQAHAAADKYYIHPSQFTAAFQVPMQDNANASGTFSNATGSYTYDAKTKTLGTLRLAVDASSLSVATRSAAHDIDALFDPDDFPELTFTASSTTEMKDDHGEVKGLLKMHGQSKPVTFDATKTSDTGLSLKTTFKRAEFAMTDDPNAINHFGDSVTLLFDVQAIRQ